MVCVCAVNIIKSSRTALPLSFREKTVICFFQLLSGYQVTPFLLLFVQLSPFSYCSASLTKLHIMNLQESKHICDKISWTKTYHLSYPGFPASKTSVLLAI